MNETSPIPIKEPTPQYRAPSAIAGDAATRAERYAQELEIKTAIARQSAALTKLIAVRCNEMEKTGQHDEARQLAKLALNEMNHAAETAAIFS